MRCERGTTLPFQTIKVQNNETSLHMEIFDIELKSYSSTVQRNELVCRLRKFAMQSSLDNAGREHARCYLSQCPGKPWPPSIMGMELLVREQKHWGTHSADEHIVCMAQLTL